MQLRTFVLRWRLALLSIALVAGSTVPTQAQALAGVHIDADGVMHKRVFDENGAVARQRRAAARSALDPQLAAKSVLRKVSLTRLEKALEEQLAKGGRPTEEMQFLAGMTRLKYVFFYPESNDIVIAGPAEGWVEDVTGRVVGLATGQPILELQDLVVALRTFKGQSGQVPIVGCSIDPTAEGLARMQAFLGKVGGNATPADTQFIVNGLRESLGLQDVSILGVPADTHFAQVMVEADYRMKLIGIGMEKPPVKLKSYVDRANPARQSRNAMQRWYFTPNYECVRVTDDELGMELVGQGVKLIGENEFVAATGQRGRTGRSDRASQAFVTGFTKQYPQLAARSPVFAQLRNLIDMTIAATYIEQSDFFAKAAWDMPLLGDETAYPVQIYATPRNVETAVTSIWKGNRLMTPLGGGVTIEPNRALASANLLNDEDGAVEAARAEIGLELQDGRWWWD